jgi:hypothetical protein
MNPKIQLIPLPTDAHQRNMMAMMVSLQRWLQIGSDEDRERRFFTHTLQYLTTYSGRQIEMEDWMITSYDVEFGHEIGSGGLYVFTFCFLWFVCSPCIASVGKCSKGVGTGQRWHSRCSSWTMVSRLALRCVRNTIDIGSFDIYLGLHSPSVTRSG